MRTAGWTILAGAALAALCSCAGADAPPVAPSPAAVAAPAPDLATRHARIREFIGSETYGPGGLVVLDVAHRALAEKHAVGEGLLVGLEDLWAHSLQEGLALFNRPDALWGRTTAEETADMIGQTTIGPWQMTVSNIRHTYGPRYGVDAKWTDAQVYAFCRDRPDVQAKMIADYIQQSYEAFGRRSPYAFQRYFWLDPFVKGEIGRADDWTRSVVAKPPPGGTWRDLTPEAKANTGFYAKQVLLGTSYTDSGLLFWLQVAGDDEGVRETLRTWRDQKRLVVAGEGAGGGALAIEGGRYARTEESGGFAVREEDVRYWTKHPEIRESLRAAIRQVAEEKAP